MGGFLPQFFAKKPDTPAAPPPPPDPNSNDPATKKATQDALNSAADQERKIRGRASTLLTGGQGDQSAAPVSKRTLLGA